MQKQINLNVFDFGIRNAIDIKLLMNLSGTWNKLLFFNSLYSYQEVKKLAETKFSATQMFTF